MSGSPAVCRAAEAWLLHSGEGRHCPGGQGDLFSCLSVHLLVKGTVFQATERAGRAPTNHSPLPVAVGLMNVLGTTPWGYQEGWLEVRADESGGSILHHRPLGLEGA